MKNIKSHLIFAALFAAISVSFAATQAAAPVASASTMASALPMVSAEVRKVDLENKKISLKHDEIINLDMPSMSMVFQVKNAAVLENIKTGDKVMFTADKVDGAYMVMFIEKAK
jgi:Cu(I)/Ag(I) efflux system periplasmic protein CusF